MMHNLSNIKHIVAIAAGKGGVGKSTLALNLSLYFQKKGFKVGLMDADLYGPSQKKMLPDESLPTQNKENMERIVPAQSRGLKFISIAHFLKHDDLASVRAPIANGIVKQFIHLVDWEDLDFLLIDFPPGTGDIQLTLIQEGLISGAVIITTPQEIAILDVKKTIAMFSQMQVPIVGLVENMSHFKIKEDQWVYPFGKGGGEQLALENGYFFLGKIPIEEKICHCCDQGKSIFEEAPDSDGVLAFANIAEKTREQLEAFKSLEGDCLKSFNLQWKR